MRPEDIQNALGNIGSDLIERANTPRLHKTSTRRSVGWIPLAAACLALVILLGVFLMPTRGPIPSLPSGRLPLTGTTQNELETTPPPEVPFLLMAPTYPSCVQYPLDYNDNNQEEMAIWYAERQAKRALFEDANIDMSDFFLSTMEEILTDLNGANGMYSPINLYLTMAMVAEISEGESRAQVLSLLGEEDVAMLREKVGALWESHYTNDGRSTLLLANSLWFDDSFTPKKHAMQILSDYYYASSHIGDLDSHAYLSAMSKWIREQTNGFMTVPPEMLKPSPDALFKMISTVYFQADWTFRFEKKRNTTEDFYTVHGAVSCEFMHDGFYETNYYQGANFSAIQLSLAGQGGMWLVLPNDGISMDTLLRDSEYCAFIQNPSAWENKEKAAVNLSIPKFDLLCKSDLIEVMQALGVKNIFSPEQADFSPIGDGTLFVEKIDHSIRCKIDENGCSAAAVTHVDQATAAPDLYVDFNLNRPFYFQITSAHGTPLFAGVINDPTLE